MDALTDKNVINAGGSLSSKGWVPPLRMTSASVMDVLSLLTDSAWVLWRPRGGVRPLQPTGPTRTGLCVDVRGPLSVASHGYPCITTVPQVCMSMGEGTRSVERLWGKWASHNPTQHTHFGLVYKFFLLHAGF